MINCSRIQLGTSNMKEGKDIERTIKGSINREKLIWETPELKKFSRKAIIKGGAKVGLPENATYTNS